MVACMSMPNTKRFAITLEVFDVGEDTLVIGIDQNTLCIGANLTRPVVFDPFYQLAASPQLPCSCCLQGHECLGSEYLSELGDVSQPGLLSPWQLLGIQCQRR